jgi:hypothetical protein
MPNSPKALAAPAKDTARPRPQEIRNRGTLLFKSLLIGTVLGPLFYLWSLLPERGAVETGTPAQVRSPISITTYDQIKHFMTRPEVYKILGGQGDSVEGPEWPHFLGHEDDQSDVVWELWTDPAAPDHWIAVGWSSGDNRHVVAIRKSGF